MRLALRALAFVFVATPLVAQTVDLSIALQSEKTSVLTGETFDVTFIVRNNGNVAADTPIVSILTSPQQRVIMTPPAGWVCDLPMRYNIGWCSTRTLAANRQASLRMTIVTRNDFDTTVRLHAGVGSIAGDDPQSDNVAELAIPMEQHPSTTALSLLATPRQNPVPPGQDAVIDLDIRNDGPAAAKNVTVREFWGETEVMRGAGWTCVAHTCTRPTLGSGESAPLTLSFPTGGELVREFRFTVGADLSFDPVGSDNVAELEIGVGNAASWRRILLPLSFAETPGAFGSLWKTEATVTVDSATIISLEPRRTCPWFACGAIPPRIPFDLTRAIFTGGPTAQFVYARAEDEPKISLNLRVRDVSRATETFGTEVPILRESDWRTTPIILAPLPVDPLFRLTLRAYDFDARRDARIAIHIYADDEIAPRATLVKTFAITPGTLTSALLPAYPGSVQLDPLAEAGDAIAGAERAWIRVEPLTLGLRLWAFASVTNNPTGHVTTVTPQ